IPSNQWFEAAGQAVMISPDGQWALITRGPAVSLYSLENGQQNNETLLGGLTKVSRAVFCGPHSLVRLGERGSERGIFLPDSDGPRLSTIPPNSFVACSADGSTIAYFAIGNPDGQIFVGPKSGPFRTFGVTGDITATAFSSDGNLLYVLL